MFQLKLCGDDEEEEEEGDEGEWSIANVFMTSLHQCLLSEDRFAIKRGQLNRSYFFTDHLCFDTLRWETNVEKFEAYCENVYHKVFTRPQH